MACAGKDTEDKLFLGTYGLSLIWHSCFHFFLTVSSIQHICDMHFLCFSLEAVKPFATLHNRKFIGHLLQFLLHVAGTVSRPVLCVFDNHLEI